MGKEIISEKQGNILISVIVPVYNTEKWLSRCLKSILNQTYSNVEVIVVNDGSTDNSLNICEQFCKEDDRVKLIDIPNSGVAVARNQGMDFCNGDYITFVDSDDYVELNYCEELLRQVLNYDASISCCYETIKECNEEEAVYYSLEKYNYMQMDSHYLAWGVLYRKNIVSDIRFDTDLFVAEDTLFFSKALKKAGGFVHTHKKLYDYVIYEQSASHGGFDKKKYTEFESWKRICELYQDTPHIMKSCKAQLAAICCRKFKEFYCDAAFEKKYRKEVVSIYRQNLFILLEYISNLKSCLSYLVFAIFPNCYTCLYMKNRGKKK